MKKLVFLILSIILITNSFSQGFKVNIVPRIKSDSLYISYVLSYSSFPNPAPSFGAAQLVVKIDESLVDLDKGRIAKTSRYDVSNPVSSNYYVAAQLTHPNSNRSAYIIRRNTSNTISPYYLQNINYDTLGVIAYPLKACSNKFDIQFDLSGSLQVFIRTWDLSNDVSSGISFVDFNGSVPKIKSPLFLSAEKLCPGVKLKVATNAKGAGYTLRVTRNGTSVLTKSSSDGIFTDLVAGTDFINNDKISITYRNTIPCPDTTVVKSIAVGNCCDSSFNNITDTYCVAGFSKKLIPNTPGGTFSGPGVSYSSLINSWVFNPKLAGAGTHVIEYKTPILTNGSCKGQISAQTLIVDPVPCKASVSNVLSKLTIPKPNGIYTNCQGEIFVSSSENRVIFKIDTFGVKSVYAGDTILPLAAKDGNIYDPVVLNRPGFCQPIGIVGNSQGDLFVADGGTQSIIMIQKSGIVKTIGGVLRNLAVTCGSSNSATVYGNLGVSRFNYVFGVALNITEDTLYVSEVGGNRISGIELKSGNYKSFLVAGGNTSTVPVNGPTASATFKSPQHISVSGNYLYVADNGNNMVRRIDLKAGKVITLAGKVRKVSDPASLINVDTSLAILYRPSAAVADCDGNVYVVEPTNNWILRVNQLTNTMTVTRFAGDPTGAAGSTNETFDEPQAISLYTKGFIDVADYRNDRIVRIAVDDWADKAFKRLDFVYCLNGIKDTIEPIQCAGKIFCSDKAVLDSIMVSGVKKYVFKPIKVGTFTVYCTYRSGQCSQTLFKVVKVVDGLKPNLGNDLSFCDQNLKINVKNGPFKLFTWNRDNVAVAVPNTQDYINVNQMTGSISDITVQTVDMSGCIKKDTLRLSRASSTYPNITIQNLDVYDTICAGKTARLLAIFSPAGDAVKYLKSWNTNNPVDTTTQLTANASYKYVFTIADKNSPTCTKSFEKNIIIKDAPQGCYSLTNNVTGNEIDIDRYTVSTLPNIIGFLNKPLDVVYRNGELFIADGTNHKIKKYNIKTGVLSDFIGDGTPGYTDSLAPNQTKLKTPSSIAFDSKGNLFICNLGGNYISKYDIAKNKVYAIAGDPTLSGFKDGEGTFAMFDKPTHLEVDPYGNVYVTDNLNNAIRKLSPVFNKYYYSVVTYTGFSGQQGAVDGKPKVAKFDYPWGIALSNQGLVISEDINDVIRKINRGDTVATLYSGAFKANGDVPPVETDPVAALSARYDKPWGLAVNKQGQVFVADGNNNDIKKIDKYGRVTTIAGLGSSSPGNTDGDAYIATFTKPTAIAFGADAKTFYVSDRDNASSGTTNLGAIRRIRKADTILVCASDFKDNMTYVNQCLGPYSFSKWIYKKSLTAKDSIITSVTTNGGIAISKAGLYINEIRDSLPNRCGSVYRDSVWFLPKFAPFLTTSPVINVQSKYCLDQELDIKLVSSPPLTGINTYRFSAVKLFATPLVNTTGQFRIKFDRAKLLPSTTSIINFIFNIQVKDADGCTYDLGDNRFFVNNLLGLEPIKDTMVCAGDTVKVSAIQQKNIGANEMSYTWKPSGVIYGVTDQIVQVGADTKKKSTAKIVTPTDVKITVVQGLSSSVYNPNGCKDSTSFNVKVKPFPLVLATPDTGLCGGNNSNITLKAAVAPPANNGPYLFTWYNLSQKSDSTLGDTKVVSPLVTTQYRVKVKGGNGCSAFDSTMVGVGAPPIAKIDLPSKDTTVCPKTDLILRGSATGGKPYAKLPKYRFEWRNADDNIAFSNNNPQVFSADKTINIRLSVKDSIGCSSIDSVKINVNSFQISGGQNDTTICQGTNITAKPVVASGSTSYTYLWDRLAPLLDDPTRNAPKLTPTKVADTTRYILTVTDNYNCKLKDTVTIKVGTNPLASISAQKDFCEKQSYVLHSLVSGGELPYRYIWTEPSGQSIGFAASDTAGVVLAPNAVGTSYTLQLKVVDKNLCESATASHLFEVHQAPYVVLGADTVLCNGKTALASANFPQNAGLNLDFAWFKDGVSNSNISNSQLLDAAGLYKVVLTSDMGCVNADSIAVASKDSIESILPTLSGTCKGQPVKLLVSINKGTPDYTVKWTTDGVGTLQIPTDRITGDTKDSIVYSSLDSDADYVKFSVQVSNACNVQTATIDQFLGAAPKAIISSVSPNAYINQPVDFTQNSVNYDSLRWDFGDKSPLLNSKDIKVTHTYIQDNVFTAVLWAINKNGCVDTDTIRVPIINNQNIFIPNVFNPSSTNPENSNVKVYGINVANSGFSFVVFNRWGQVVYETSDFIQANKIGWNGKLQNTGDDLALGAYTYLLKGKYGDGKEFEKVGTITLVK